MTLARMSAPVLRNASPRPDRWRACVLGLEVDRLTARHTDTADRAREQLHQAHADGRIRRQRRVASEQLECKRLECVAHEECRCLVVGLVARRPAPAQIVVVHRRQIIVHQ